ncbi:MAG: glutathione S-transferase family protein [Acetobacteraceae bacterium]|nr:glutathione S-transferase family protein [Acetobacteraceae bacterium]
MPRQLYELAGEDPARRFSPYCWRIRMALAHKGLEAEVIPWRFTETDRLAFAGTDKVPVLVDGERTLHDSTVIAEYLDQEYPKAPTLFRGDPAARAFTLAWTNAVLHPALVRLIVADIPALLDPHARSYFIKNREARFGMTLAQVAAGRDEQLPQFRALLAPLRHVVAASNYLGGTTPDYADYAVFGAFQWARCVSPFKLLEESDPVFAWRGRMLDLFGGLARNVPAFD